MNRILMAFGLLWLFVWCVAGFYIGSQHMHHIQEMGELSHEGNLVGFWNTLSAWKMSTSIHSHALCFAFLLILMALVMPSMRYSDKSKKILGLILILGVMLS